MQEEQRPVRTTTGPRTNVEIRSRTMCWSRRLRQRRSWRGMSPKARQACPLARP